MQNQIDISERLRLAAEHKNGITLIGQDEDVFLSYSEVWKSGLFLSNHLKSLGVKPGNEIVIQCKKLKYRIYAFWACLLGGFVAVPVEVGNNQYQAEANNKIYKMLNQPYFLFDTTENNETKDPIFYNQAQALNISLLDYTGTTVETDIYQPSVDDISYLQYTSGSTGSPKGSILKTSNIAADVNGIIERYEIDESDSILSWQSLNHCYGLVAYHLVGVACGINQYLIPTELYMHNPLIWFEKANQYKTTRLGTIPFAMRHFINFHEKSMETKDWDLSFVKSLFVGAELVKEELCDKFVEVTKKYNLPCGVVKPMYGLSEATAVVTAVGMERPFSKYKMRRDSFNIGDKAVWDDNFDTNKSITFTGVGKVLSGSKIRIADDMGSPLPEHTIGNVLISGTIVTAGYYKAPIETQESFGEDGWLRTGDIGFLNDGELVIIGRNKEIIVVAGMKYTCNVIEDMIHQKIEAHYGQPVVCSCVNPKRKSEGAVVFIQCNLDFEDPQELRSFIEYGNDIRDLVYKDVGFIIDNVVPVQVIPKTASGKVRRRLLGDQFNRGEFAKVIELLDQAKQQEKQTEKREGSSYSRASIADTMVKVIREMFSLEIDDYNLAFQDFGVVSINVPPFIKRINQIFSTDFHIASFFNYSSVNKLSEYIYNELTNKEKYLVSDNLSSKVEHEDRVAIIGMSCRFPGGANSVKEFWDVLVNGKDGIIEVPENRWDMGKYFDEDENAPGKMYCQKGGFLTKAIDEFDAQFFNISPKEAAALDPQQRMMLELTWEAFENAGLDITKFNGSDTGVYLGISTNEYMMAHVHSGDLSKIDAYSLTGACISTACGRISYTFGFEGPSLTVDTACSSSLTALHVACKEMKEGAMEMAVVGGVNLMVTPAPNVGFSKLRATSKDGHSKSFDASASGYGRAEGAGIILLKMLSKAQRDNDIILGVIDGTCINQDGKSNGLTAPNGVAQTKLIEKALASAQLSSNDIDYVEMHGTGTPLGDPIEVSSVVAAYCKNRDSYNPLKIGSVKSNIGHTEAAAGMASIIKVLLSFKHNLIPANLHFKNPNPLIDWNSFPVEVVKEHAAWNADGKLRRAGINGFGFGGSNAHVILEDYQETQATDQKTGNGINYILKISAKKEVSLLKKIEQYEATIAECAEGSFGDFVYSANRGRADMDCRFAVTGDSKSEILERIRTYLAGGSPEGVYSSAEINPASLKNRKIVFMFTGQGSQYLGMGKMLFETQEVFKEAITECDRMFYPYILRSVIELIYGTNTSEELIENTANAQCLIFSIEYALWKLWKSYGINPEIVMGHSIGEYPAAVASGMLSLEDAVKLVSIRGRLMDSAPGKGAMGTIFEEESKVGSMLEGYLDKVSIAACNARENFVVSGDADAVEEILERSRQQGIKARKLKVSHGFHSNLMEPILGDFKRIADSAVYQKSNIRFVSSMHAREIDENEVLNAEYWTSHIRSKVDFYNAVMSIPNPSDYIFLEIGSKRVLSALCTLIFDGIGVVAASLNPKKSDERQLAESIAMLYSAGVDLDWEQIECKGQKTWTRIELPNYHFDRIKHWKMPVYDRENTGEITEKGYPVLGQKIESPFLNGTTVFQRRFSSKEPYFMREHIIFDTYISPAAAHTSMLLSAMKEIANSKNCKLVEVELRSPLAIYGDEERTVQICVEKDVWSGSDFSIISRKVEGGDWVIHAKGKVVARTEFAETENKFDLEEIKELPFEIDQGIYEVMHASGFRLGDSFRRIMKVYSEDDHGICYIEPLRTVPEFDDYEFYPGLIDSVLQTMFCVELRKYREDENVMQRKKTIVPYFLGEISYNYVKSDKLWVKIDVKTENDIVQGNMDVFNENGETVMILRDILAKLTERETLLADLGKDRSDFYYQVDWVETERNKNAETQKKYVIIADDQTEAYELCQYLDVGEENCYSIDLCDNEDNVKLLENIQKAKREIVYLPGAGEGADQDLAADAFFGLKKLKGLFNLTQSLDKNGLIGECVIKIVTRGAQRVAGQGSVNPGQSLLWGFAKTLRLEYPHFYGGIIDMEVADFSGQAEVLALEIANEMNDEVCLRGGKRYISMLVNQESHTKNENAGKIEISDNATYIITGGTGALGMSYAKILIEKGARVLVLVCRREPNEKVRETCAQWSKIGVNIKFAFLDVVEEKQDALMEICAQLPPVKGIIHAAGTLNDRVIADLTWKDFEFVLNPKIQGACNMYRLFEKEELDFFLMTSSITSVLGNLAQSNYAAANSFMNSLAQWMNAIGKPGFSYCWGPWETGMAGDDIIRKNIDRMGIHPLTTETAEKMISDFFEMPFTNIIGADVDWEKYVRIASGETLGAFYSQVVGKGATPKEDQTTSAEHSILRELKNLTQDKRKSVLIVELQKICGKILGFEKDQLPQADKSFKELGADSLMIFSIRSSVNKLLEMDLKVSDFYNFPTLIKLVEHLIDDVLFEQEEETEISYLEIDELTDELERMIYS
ncbi:MAG: SDR family NAD(P)-dependent oxidoreductase [Oscillospiraceae bacterium]|nr:SDR family NAD(P)-dependent oxidoreductase [Oscillospiraceae bacterium]